ncbi:MAG: hypothetical protein Q8873_08045 [Bacillota bacterium]|nr:hypothetical protein [Bacillota bacterium]
MLITSPYAKFSENKVYIFKKSFYGTKNGHCTINITADARYKLYIDNTLVAYGPQKGAERERYYDTVCLDEYLKNGLNEIVVEVMQLKALNDSTDCKHLISVNRSGAINLAVWGEYKDEKETIVLDTDETWLVAEETNRQLISGTHFIKANEHIYSKWEPEWNNSIVIGKIETSENSPNMYGEIGDYYVMPRTISPMQLRMRCVNIVPEKPNVYDAYELTVGFVKVKFSGKGKIKLIYAECFKEIKEDGTFKKGDRTDLNGDATTNCCYDVIECDGISEWESFWTRTFRYITVETEGSAQVDYIYYIESCYPAKIGVIYDFANEMDNRLWQISARTLQCCMQETYVDCPYYEQLQYAMDTYLQMIYTYQVSHDDRLARNAISLFRKSQRMGGFTTSRYPSIIPQIIPGFSLFYVFMVKEHYIRYGDINLVKENLRSIQRVLDVFENNRDGLVQQSNYWNFVDWADGWERGVPDVEKDEPIAIYSLMYAYALKQTAYLLEVLDMDGDVYNIRAQEIIDEVNKTCYDAEKELYANGPNKKTFSQHMQVWAVLTDCADKIRGKEILKKSFTLKVHSTFAFDYFLLRGLEKVEMYERRADILAPYYELINKHCTTIPETPFENTRSECHAWGAVVLYEFTARDLGVTWENNRYGSKIYIKPYTGSRKEAKGKVCTPFGDVFVEWKNNGKFMIELYTPEDVVKVITLPDGNITETKEGYILCECEMDV